MLQKKGYQLFDFSDNQLAGLGNSPCQILAEPSSRVSPLSIYFKTFHHRHERMTTVSPGGGGTPYNGLYGEAPPERGTFFTLQVYKRVGISQV